MPLNTHNLALAALSVWGGIVRWLRQKRYQGKPWDVAWELITVVLTSAFAGILVLSICFELKMGLASTAVCVGMAGYSAGLTLHVLEQWLIKKLNLGEAEAPKRRRTDRKPLEPPEEKDDGI